MLKLVIVKFLSCLRFKTLKTIPCSVTHDSYSFGQYRSQLGDNAESVPARTGVFITLFSSHLCGKNVLAVVHIGDCMSLTDCVLYHNNNNIIH